MRTEARRWSGSRDARVTAGLLLAITFATTPSPVDAQDPLFLVDGDTRIASVDFRFPGGRVLPEQRLRDGIASKGPGALATIRSALDFLPGIDTPEHAAFSPLTLQKDVVRLRRILRRTGYPVPRVDYEARLDADADLIAVTFVVEAGPPARIDTLCIVGPSGAPLTDRLPSRLAGRWQEERKAIDDGFDGLLYGETARLRLTSRARAWLRDRGYPFADVRVSSADTTARLRGRAEVADTVELGISATVEIDPGPIARVDSIEVEGNRRLKRGDVLRELPLAPGDLFSAARLSDGQRGVFELDIVRRALGDVPQDQPEDASVRVRLRIDEARPRLVSGRIGYGSGSGTVAQTQWTHRDFLGGARTLTVSGLAETGWLSLDDAVSRGYGLSLTLRQPYWLHRRVSASLGPFVRYGEDLGDRSLTFGLDAFATYRRSAHRSVTLRYELSRRRVDDGLLLIPVGDTAFGQPLPHTSFLKSLIELGASWGRLDDDLSPRSGYLVRPEVAVTDPTGLADVEYFRTALRALGAAELGKGFALLGRMSAGRLVPFARSLPSRTVRTDRAFVAVRGEMFTAGGTGSVRGWGEAQLGPKVPDPRSSGSRYLPVGGLASFTASSEAILPFPFLSAPHATFVFADVGRVWSPGGRFDAPEPVLVQDRLFVGIGGGLELSTPVGPVRLAVGWKANPSPLDVRDPGAVLKALREGRPLSSVPTNPSRRWHLHLSLGRSF